MKEKTNLKKHPQKRPLVIGIIASIMLLGIISYGFAQYQAISGLIDKSNSLVEQKKYKKALEKLEHAKGKWVSKNLSAKEDVIEESKEKIKELIEDESEYNEGIVAFSSEDWRKAKDLLSKVSQESPYFQEAQTKKEKAEEKITQQKIGQAVEEAQEQTEAEISELQQQLEQEKSEPGNLSIQASEIEPYLSSVVEVSCKDAGGSGFLWKTRASQESQEEKSYIPIDERWNWLVITNEHIAEEMHYTEPDGPSCVIIAENESGRVTNISSAKRWSSSLLNNKADITALKIDKAVKELTTPRGGLNYNLVDLQKCPSSIPVGSPVVIIGYPKFGEQESYYEGPDISATKSNRMVTNGIISSRDTAVSNEYFGTMDYPNYFISAKIDSGNSGGIALSKDNNGLCFLGVPTWLNLGNYETQGIVQNIHNIIKE